MRGFVRWVVRIVVAMVLVVAVALVVVYWRSNALLAQRIDVNEAPLPIPADAAAIARGEHLAVTRGCAECHGTDFGGKIVVDALPVGHIFGPNITRGKGGLRADFSAVDWERAIRHGLGAGGRMLRIMPSRDFAALADADTADMVAYLQQLPPVDRDLGEVTVGAIPRLQMLLDQVPLADARMIDHRAAHAPAMPVSVSADFGAYVAHTCSGCHGEHFSGGRIPGLPPSFPAAANITPSGIGKWTKVDFYTALREGKRPDGTAIDPFMPWATFKQMSDTELDAVWMFLQALPPRESGTR